MKIRLTFALCVSLAFALPLDAAVDYVREVKPVLSENCYRCHGASQQKGGLRLDTAAFAAKGGDNGPSLKAGQPADSLLLQAIKGVHADIPRMPYKKPPLRENQIATIEKWITEGASAPANEEPEKVRHWALVPPLHSPLPKVADSRWPRNAIDFFILARLEKEKIKPAPEADRVTLIRRLSLDLIGLPPTIAEV